MQKFHRWLPIGCALSVGLLVSNAPGAQAQIAATVTVNASSSIATIQPAAFGTNVGCGDGEMVGPNITSALKNAGISGLRYPGGGSADFFHWQTTSATPGSNAWVNSNDTFDSFMTQLAQPIGAQPVISVNYGSNAAGTGGGDPSEAAAWVDYANNNKHYGVKYWEIGNECYGDWDYDLHTSKGPVTYGANVVQFVNAMKAKDPTIKVGVVLTTPGFWPDGATPDWNTNVLAQCGSKIDFVIVHYYPIAGGSETDAGTLGSSSLISGMCTKLKSLINQYCGSNAPNVQIFVTEMNSSSNPGKQTVSLVNALFAADQYMTWLENGAANIDWWNVHNGPVTNGNNSSSLYGNATFGDYGLLANGVAPEPSLDTPFPSYYGVQMLSKLGKSGDTIVPATTSQSLLTAHAVKQANGNLALLLINKDPSNSYAANVSLTGYTPTSTATEYFYGENSTAITSSSVSTGSSVSVTVPPYSLTTIVMAPGAAPAFTITASASPNTVAPGSATTVTASPKDTGGALSNANVLVSILNASGATVASQNFSGVNFSAGQTVPCAFSWTPTAAGTYTIVGGVFDQNWTTTYTWNNNMGTITVASGDVAQYNFESGTQSWTSSAGLSSSTTQAFAGTHALAVSINNTAAATQTVSVNAPSTPAGKTITFHVWIPSGSAISSIQAFAQQGSAGNWAWAGNWQPIGSIKTNAWNTLTVAVPSNAVTPLNALGVQFSTSGSWTGTCYVDSISW